MIEQLDRRAAADVTEAEVQAFRKLAGDLSAADWDRPVLSTGWRVRDVVAHVAGQLEEQTRFPMFVRRLRLARKRYPDRIVLDGHNQVQIDELAGGTPADLLALLDRYAPSAMRAIRRMPGPLRRMPSRWFFPEPPLPDPRLAYIFDVLAARDTWMHRLEVARSTGHAFVVGGHDVTIVRTVLRDLESGWRGPSLTLVVTGAATEVCRLGDGTPAATATVDAVELMLHLSGRGGLALPEDSPLAPARVVF
jgi:uncharacterized protein (TIGR03083 family)